MNVLAVPAFGEATLSDCDREPIHIPGAIQAHGILLVLSEPDLIIRQASVNMRFHLGLAAERMLGQGLSLVLDEPALRVVQAALAGDLVEPRYLPPVTTSVGTRMEALLHRTGVGLILELEPFVPQPDLDLPRLFRRMLDVVHAAPTMIAACDAAARHLREIIGFDRVMLYRFREDGAGTVIAEDRREDLEPFLGLHYPATDIPVQARKLFVLNPLRVWAGTDDAPAPLIPALNPTMSAPLDMSRCVLRAASPVHLEYLRNMGVGASTALSIVRDGELWGLIACHHMSPRYVSHAHRLVCDALGHLLTAQIEAKEQEDRSAEIVRLHSWSIRALAVLGAGSDTFKTLQGLGTWLLKFVPAAGVAVHVGGRTAMFGQVPDLAEVESLAGRLRVERVGDVVAAHTVRDYPGSAPPGICGLLAVPASREPGDFLMWFRPEIVRTVTWAGDPSKPVGTGPLGGRLTPRASFADWVTTVRGQSEPWSVPELEAARALRLALLELAPQRRDDRAGNVARVAETLQPALSGEANLRVANALSATEDAGELARRLVVALKSLSEGLRRG